ncbi:MAG: hypothetical protein EBT45_08505 [Alphaproteobacteria bacterium]|nr:hypothetical protein [Alphaproteobacteria bacterium]
MYLFYSFIDALFKQLSLEEGIRISLTIKFSPIMKRFFEVAFSMDLLWLKEFKECLFSLP